MVVGGGGSEGPVLAAFQRRLARILALFLRSPRRKLEGLQHRVLQEKPFNSLKHKSSVFTSPTLALQLRVYFLSRLLPCRNGLQIKNLSFEGWRLVTHQEHKNCLNI